MIHRLPEFDDQVHVFADRADAGRQLSRLLAPFTPRDTLVLAIPCGGVKVAVEVALAQSLPLDVAVVSKVTLPWNTEVGCGAVASDGSIELDERFAAQLGLTDAALRFAVEQTRQKVARRVKLFHRSRPIEPIAGRPVVLIDDGVASGATLLLAASAARRSGASRVAVAIPTGPSHSLDLIGARVDEVFCANVRRTGRFSVAAAYRDWHDETEEDTERLLASLNPPKAA